MLINVPALWWPLSHPACIKGQRWYLRKDEIQDILRSLVWGTLGLRRTIEEGSAVSLIGLPGQLLSLSRGSFSLTDISSRGLHITHIFQDIYSFGPLLTVPAIEGTRVLDI